MKAGTTIWTALSFALVLVSAAVARAASDVETPQAVVDALKATGRARVIVQLDAPDATLADEDLEPAARVARRAAIARARTTTVSRLKRTAAKMTRDFEHVPFVAFEVDAAALAELETAPAVVAIFDDRFDAVQPTLGQSIPIVDAQGNVLGPIDGSGWAVAILDTGISAAHSMLAGRVVQEACFACSGNCPNASTVQIGPGAAAETGYHGTHVAGIAVGASTTVGGVAVAGVARGADIIAVRVLGGGNCWSDIVAGLDYVYGLRTTRQIAAVNMSLGNGTRNLSPCDAAYAFIKTPIDNLRAANIATVASAGNEYYTNGLAAPACVSSAISVGSTTKSGQVSSFSNSANYLSLLAPGSSIQSAYPGNQLQYLSGTSMAAPHVAGAWAALREAAPSNTVSQILAALRSHGVSITDVRNNIAVPEIRVRRALLGLVNYCGNGVVEAGEHCDNGAGNSDTTPNACRTDCRFAYCGDGVVDTGEQCDNGSANSDTTPGACRRTCESPRCGDRVIDPGESCDDGGTAAGDCCSPVCQVDANGTPCDDGLFCNGSNACSNGACAVGASPCSGAHCDVCIEEFDACGCRFVAGDPYDGVEAILDGVCGDGSASGAFCSLRGAVQEANARPGPDLISLPLRRYQLFRNPGGSCNASDGDIDITDDVAIRGVTEATIDARKVDRVFRVHPGVHAAMEAIGIENGLPNQIVCGENDPCTGATVIACVLAGDDSDTAGNAGKPHYLGPFAFGSWSNPQCGTSGSGWHSPLGTCGSGAGSGHKRCSSVLAVSNVCPATGGKGGAVYSEGILDLRRVGFYQNSAAGDGGAIAVEGTNAELRIVGADFANNVSPGNGGVVSYRSTGIGGQLKLRDFVARDNRSYSKASGTGGGALYTASTAAEVRIENSTFYGNAAYANAGAIYFVNVGDASNACHPEQDAVLNNVTIHGNRSDDDGSGQGEGGGIYHDHICTCGGGCTAPLDIEFFNSLLGGNSGGGTGDCFLGYPYPLGGAYNAIQNPGACSLGSMTPGTVITGQDPLVQFGYWGGPRFASRLLAGSPALAAGNPAAPGTDSTACLPVDSLGVSRPQGPTAQVRCDLGAMEDPTGLTRVPPCRGFLCGRITPRAGVSVQFSEVLEEGELSAQPSGTGPALPDGFDVGGASEPFVDVATTAPFMGQTALCLSYDPGEFAVDSRVEVLRFDGGAWTSLDILSRNPADHEVCVDVSQAPLEDMPRPQNGFGARVVLGQRPVCPIAPAAGCQQAGYGNATLQLRGTATADPRAQLKWSWKQATTEPAADFGNPVAADGYAFCVYDEAGDTPDLIYSAEIPAGGNCAGRPCWRGKGAPSGSKGYGYGDKHLTPDGIQKLQLKPGATGAAQIKMQGQGSALGLPPMPLAVPLRTQLHAENGQCWEAAFTQSGVKGSKPGAFKAVNR